jgi:hypothetical protein
MLAIASVAAGPVDARVPSCRDEWDARGTWLVSKSQRSAVESKERSKKDRLVSARSIRDFGLPTT